MDTSTLLGFLLLLGIPVSAIASFALERRRREAMTGTKPYTWGIFTGLLNVVFGVAFLVGAILNLLAPSTDHAMANVFVGLAIGIVEILAGYYTIQRRRVAFVIGTIISLNPVWWIANAIYGRNRWGELIGDDEPNARAVEPTRGS